MQMMCWNKIGVQGDRSCPELNTFIHCRNCPVYGQAGRGLLERENPNDYLEFWTEVLGEASLEKNSHATDFSSLLIFRLGIEWLALSTVLFKEVSPPTVIHTLPHRSNDILLGITNIKGRILPCFSLKNFLRIQTSDPIQNPNQIVNSSIMTVVEKNKNCWVFSVDEVGDIYHCRDKDLQVPPSTITKATDTYTKWIISWQNKLVNYLDDDLLFAALSRRII